MAKRFETRLVKVEKDLEVTIWTCDSCGVEMTTSRDVYFGDERLVIEGEDKTWLRVWARESKHDYPAGDSLDFCSPECVAAWSAKVKVDA